MQITHGQQMAAMVLTGHELGLDVGYISEAEKILKGVNVHPMISCAVSKEACALNNRIRHDASMISKANTICDRILESISTN